MLVGVKVISSGTPTRWRVRNTTDLAGSWDINAAVSFSQVALVLLKFMTHPAVSFNLITPPGGGVI